MKIGKHKNENSNREITKITQHNCKIVTFKIFANKWETNHSISQSWHRTNQTKLLVTIQTYLYLLLFCTTVCGLVRPHLSVKLQLLFYIRNETSDTAVSVYSFFGFLVLQLIPAHLSFLTKKKVFDIYSLLQLS